MPPAPSQRLCSPSQRHRRGLSTSSKRSPKRRRPGGRPGLASSNHARRKRPTLLYPSGRAPPFGFTQIITKHGPRRNPGRRPENGPGRPSARASALTRRRAAVLARGGPEPDDCATSAQRSRDQRCHRLATEVAGIARYAGLAAPGPRLQHRAEGWRTGRFGFSVAGSDVFLEAGVGLAERLSRVLHHPRLETRSAGAWRLRKASLLKNRLAFVGVTGLGSAGGAS